MEYTIDEYQIAIRSWEDGDAESLAKHANNINIWKGLRDIFPHPYSVEDAQAYIQRAKSDGRNTHCVISINGNACGAISLLPKEDVYRQNVEIGYWLSEEYWGKGITTEAVRRMLDKAFDDTNIQRVYSAVFSSNQASAKVLFNAGMKREAIIAGSIIKDGYIQDEWLFSMQRMGRNVK